MYMQTYFKSKFLQAERAVLTRSARRTVPIFNGILVFHLQRNSLYKSRQDFSYEDIYLSVMITLKGICQYILREQNQVGPGFLLSL